MSVSQSLAFPYNQSNYSVYDDYEAVDLINNSLTTEYDNVDETSEWMNNALKIYMWFYTGVGLPTNILIIATIKKFQVSSPASNMLVYMAVIDCLSLVAKLVESNVMGHGIDIGWFGCKIIHVPSSALSAISNWTLVLMCAERYVAICHPMDRQRWISNKRCRKIVVWASVVLTLFTGVYYFVFADQVDSSCTAKYISKFSFIGIICVFIAVIPFIGLIIMTIAITRALLISRYNRYRLQANELVQNVTLINIRAIASTSGQMEKTMSLLMISEVLIYCFIHAPFTVFFLVVLPTYDFHLPPEMVKLLNIFFMLADLCHAVNFFVYFTLVKGFRSNVYKLIRSLCP